MLDCDRAEFVCHQYHGNPWENTRAALHGDFAKLGGSPLLRDPLKGKPILQYSLQAFWAFICRLDVTMIKIYMHATSG
jgi:hypothetical protein